MKSKLIFLLGLAVALVVGFLAGRYHVRHSPEKHYLSIIMPEVRRATGDFSHAAGLLKAIRSGDTNEAIETLEDDLDANILLIGAAFEMAPVAERDKQWISRIRWLREHRAEHPRKTESETIDQEVAHILSLVDTNR